MKYLGAYMMAVLGGKESPSAADVKQILEAGGNEFLAHCEESEGSEICSQA